MTTEAKDQETWVGIKEVSTHLSVNKETIRRWIKKRGFPVYRIGRLLRFRYSDVDQWVLRSDALVEDRDHA